jgi:hypothetical protein
MSENGRDCLWGKSELSLPIKVVPANCGDNTSGWCNPDTYNNSGTTTTVTATATATTTATATGGVWSEWINAMECNKSCGGGTLTQNRTCTITGGCTNIDGGISQRTIACNDFPCYTEFDGKSVRIQNNDMYLEGKGLVSSGVSSWNQKTESIYFELTPDNRIKSSLTGLYIQENGDNVGLTFAEYAENPRQKWSFVGKYLKSDNGLYITRSTVLSTKGFPLIIGTVNPVTEWSLIVNYPKRNASKFGNLTVKDFYESNPDTLLNIGLRFNNWNPSFTPGIPVMDRGGNVLFVTLVDRNDSKLKWELSWYDGNGVLKVLDLQALITPWVGIDYYSNYTRSFRMTFNKDNHAFIPVNSNKLIHFNYMDGGFFEEPLTVSGQMESQYHTNNPFYNDYPIFVNLTTVAQISRYENGGYKTYSSNPNEHWGTPMNLNGTVSHSGRNSMSYTVGTKTFVCYMTDVSDKDISNGTPQWINYFDHNTKTWGTPVLLGYSGTNIDDHNAPAMTVTSTGYIYVFFGTHINDAYYTKSSKAYDTYSFGVPILLSTIKSKISNTHGVTYPGVNIDKNDNIYVTYRGPWYGFSMYKIDKAGVVTGKQLIERVQPIKIYNDIPLKDNNDKYVQWRDSMLIDNNGNMYIYMSPTPLGTSWVEGARSKTGPFVIVSTDQAKTFKIIE